MNAINILLHIYFIDSSFPKRQIASTYEETEKHTKQKVREEKREKTFIKIIV